MVCKDTRVLPNSTHSASKQLILILVSFMLDDKGRILSPYKSLSSSLSCVKVSQSMAGLAVAHEHRGSLSSLELPGLEVRVGGGHPHNSHDQGDPGSHHPLPLNLYLLGIWTKAGLNVLNLPLTESCGRHIAHENLDV